jgi:hypothetical protein
MLQDSEFKIAWAYFVMHLSYTITTVSFFLNQDNQYRLLQAVVKKVRVLQSSRAGKPGFATTKNEVAELQVLIGQYLTGCKVCLNSKELNLFLL